MKAADEACKEANLEWIVVEQVRPLNEPEADVRESRVYLEGLGYGSVFSPAGRKT
ncbi:MAG: hypothetical protein O7G87_13715 [bacterium]|nr:hypothetical protein [bacterium]